MRIRKRGENMNERINRKLFRANRGGGSGGGELPSPDEAKKDFEQNSTNPGKSNYREDKRGGEHYLVKEKGKDGYEEVWVPVKK